MPEGRDRKGRLRNIRHERFCQLYVFGHPDFNPKAPDQGHPDTRNKAATSYRAAGFKCKTAQVAATGGHRLLMRSDIRTRISELRTEEERLARTRLRRWRAMVPEAQQVLLDSMLGVRDITPAQIQAAKQVIEQGIGPSRFRFKVESGGEGDGALNVTVYGGEHGRAVDDEG